METGFFGDKINLNSMVIGTGLTSPAMSTKTINTTVGAVSARNFVHSKPLTPTQLPDKMSRD